MKRSLVLLSLLVLAGCQAVGTSPSRTPIAPAGAKAEAESRAQYILSGNVPDPGPRVLRGSETLAGTIGDVLGERPQPARFTLLLVRHSPEGLTRELVDVEPSGRLADPGRNCALREGDELVFPAPASIPDGLVRPPLARLSTGN